MLLLVTSVHANEGDEPTKVNVNNFVRAETDMYFARSVKEGAFGKLVHKRQPVPIDQQTVVRMNRDTLYSSGVFDLDAGPLSVKLPDAGKRFMSMQVINQDHYTLKVAYAPAQQEFDRKSAGTRYLFVIVRTLANGDSAEDITAANRLQDAIITRQSASGSFKVPRWDQTSQDKARDALAVLGSLGGVDHMFGSKQEVTPYDYLIGAAIGWGGNPRTAADYVSVYPKHSDGKTPHTLNVKDVPVDGFWSISVYNSKGFFEKNALDAYSINNLTAKPNADKSYTIRFGGCERQTVNCLPITSGWNYTVRLYRPRPEILDGRWKFPEAQPVK